METSEFVMGTCSLVETRGNSASGWLLVCLLILNFVLIFALTGARVYLCCKPQAEQSDDRPAAHARAKRKAVAALVVFFRYVCVYLWWRDCYAE